MRSVRLAIIYDSCPDGTYQLGRAMQAAAEDAGAVVRLRRIRERVPDMEVERQPVRSAHLKPSQHVPEATLEDFDWADALLLGSPACSGEGARPLEQFLDATVGLQDHGRLANKVVAGFTGLSNNEGNQEAMLLALYRRLYDWGSFIIPSSQTRRNTYRGDAAPNCRSLAGSSEQGISAETMSAARGLTRRVVWTTELLIAGREAVVDRLSALGL